MTFWVCKTCKSPDIEYWDNAPMCTTFDWGFYCPVCKKYLDCSSEDIETVEEINGNGSK
jgi:hypothetical protein